VWLAMIGDQWLTSTDIHGRRGLEDPNDFVRLEIEAALKRNVRIIPILVDGASMPRVDELPAGLAGLVRRQALELRSGAFAADVDIGGSGISSRLNSPNKQNSFALPARPQLLPRLGGTSPPGFV
jgi:hypothetical protein